MNRRAFLLAVPFLPGAVRAIVRRPPALRPAGPEYYWQVNSGIHGLLEQCGQTMQGPAGPDLDAIFARVYAVQRNRNAAEPLVFLRP